MTDFHEVETGEETLRDWDSYLDGYNYSSGEQYGGEDERPSFENLLTRKGTLIDHLLWQLHMGQFSRDGGYASVRRSSAISMKTGICVPRLRKLPRHVPLRRRIVLDCSGTIQEFDPPGVAARDLRECLLIQARFLGMQGSVVRAFCSIISRTWKSATTSRSPGHWGLT